MTQPDSTSWLQDGWKVAQSIFGGFLLVMGWFGRRALDRLDSLERTAVTRDELKSAFAEMRDDRKVMHVENQQSLRRIEDKLDATEPGAVAARLTRAESDIRELREWKHQVDPYIDRGRIDP